MYLPVEKEEILLSKFRIDIRDKKVDFFIKLVMSKKQESSL